MVESHFFFFLDPRLKQMKMRCGALLGLAWVQKREQRWWWWWCIIRPMLCAKPDRTATPESVE